MNYLAIDTSNKNLTVIFYVDNKEYSIFRPNCGVNHSVELMPAIEKAVSTANKSLDDVDFICAVVGAGSFTGIRIGVSTAKALCFAKNKPCLAVTSFDTMAYNKKDENLLAVIDAKHDSYYVCGYKNSSVSFAPSFVGKQEVLNLSKEYTLISTEEIEGLKTTIVSPLEGLKKAIEAKIGEVTFDLESLSPLYIRKSQAEEGR